MRPWVGPIGFIGAAASLVFWLVVPFGADGHNLYVHAGNEVFYIVFAAMSLVGLAGATVAGGDTRVAPSLMAIAIIPAIGALLVPGLLIIVAVLLEMDAPQAGRAQGPQEAGGSMGTPHRRRYL